MKVKQIGRKGIALASAFVLLSLAAQPKAAYGAGGIETDRTDCRITFDLSVSYPDRTEEASPSVRGDRYEELNTSSITVNLYRVASVDVSGKYEAVGPYEEGLGEELGAVSHETTAQTWETLAKTAYEIAVPEAASEEGDAEETESKGTAKGDTPVKSVTFTAGAAEADRTASGLAAGLYLAAAQDVLTTEYIYHFTPYLIALPGNNYYPEEDDDEWQYEVTVGLKPGQEPRYGSLLIEKTLKSYDETLGGASFIFDIKAVKKIGNEEIVVYSDVRSLVFDRVGTRSVLIAEKIPVGASVTVTEVYSGACYQETADTAKEQTKKIQEAGETVEVNFTNDYDGRINSGSSIVNAFSLEDGDWKHQKWKDSLGDLLGR